MKSSGLPFKWNLFSSNFTWYHSIYVQLLLAVESGDEILWSTIQM